MSNDGVIVGAEVPVLVITGTMGSGKTTMLGEASDLLTAQGVRHAAVDLDTLAVGHLTEHAWVDLPYRNLRSVWQNYAAAGATRLLIAEAVEHSTELDHIRQAIPGARIVVCRLRASLATMQARIAQREPGMHRAAFIQRVVDLDALLDAASVEDFCVATDDDQSVTEAAAAMLVRANWLP